MYVKAPIPSEVYHLTKKANLESILDDGAIRRFDDTECWFCESLAKMKAYMEQTVLCEGKPYYGVGGQLCRYPKFEPDEHIILKLTPCRREGNWYRWNQEIPLNSPPELVQVAAEFSKLKIGFRGDLPFRNAEAFDVAEFLYGSIVCRNVQTTSELWKRLSEKVEQNWQTYQRNLYDRSPGVLIGIADEIAATATCYSEFLCSGSDLSRRDLSYLLQFENPLDVLRDRWVLDQSTEQGTRFLGMLESLRSEGHAEQDYPLDEAYAQTQKNEMTMQLYKDVTEAAREVMRELVDRMESVADPPASIQQKLLELALELRTVSGKKQYAYLKKSLKDMVDSIVDELEKLPEVAAYYSVWNGLRDTLEGYYKNRPRQHNPLSQQKEFRAIKNAIIQEAERLWQQMEQKSLQDEEPSAENTSTDASANPTLANENTSFTLSRPARLPTEYLLNSTVRLFHQVGQIFRDNAAPPSNPMGIRIDSKRRKKLMQKRLAMGHKQDDHEQEQGYGQVIR